MEATSPAGEPSDLKQLSDDELVQLFPVREAQDPTEEGEEEALKENRLTAKERQAIEEVWRRHSEDIQKYLKYKVYSTGSTLCPPQEPAKEHFATMCFHETYLAFLKRAHRNVKSVRPFVLWTALCAAIDLRRQIAKKRGPTKRDAEREKKKIKLPVEMGPLDDANITTDECREADELVALRELRDILDDYAGKSLDNLLSVKLGRLRRRDNKSWQEVLATVEKWFPGAISGSTPDARMKKLRDKEKHDRNEILPLLEEYGIRDPSLLDALLAL